MLAVHPIRTVVADTFQPIKFKPVSRTFPRFQPAANSILKLVYCKVVMIQLSIITYRVEFVPGQAAYIAPLCQITRVTP